MCQTSRTTRLTLAADRIIVGQAMNSVAGVVATSKCAA